MYTNDDCPNLRCGDCKYYSVSADRKESLCKRIDHKTVKFYKPFFACYDCEKNHIICDSFEPAHPEYADFKGKWTNFYDFYKVYEEVWCAACEKRGVMFFVNDNLDIAYRVPLKTFLEGPIVKDGILQAFEKVYYKKTMSSPFGYTLITEKIDGVSVEQ